MPLSDQEVDQVFGSGLIELSSRLNPPAIRYPSRHRRPGAVSMFALAIFAVAALAAGASLLGAPGRTNSGSLPRGNLTPVGSASPTGQTRSCVPGDLLASEYHSGPAGGAMQITIVLTNVSTTACSIKQSPAVTFFGLSATPYSWSESGQATPPILLTPSGSRRLRAAVAPYCGLPEPTRVEIATDRNGPLAVMTDTHGSMPDCNDHHPPTVSVLFDPSM